MQSEVLVYAPQRAPPVVKPSSGEHGDDDVPDFVVDEEDAVLSKGDPPSASLATGGLHLGSARSRALSRVPKLLLLSFLNHLLWSKKPLAKDILKLRFWR